jgi:Sec1 family
LDWEGTILISLQRLATLVARNNKLASGVEPVLSSSANIDSLIVLDRHVDLVTPMLTQLTYEGLIDECVGIRNCKLLSSFDKMLANERSACRIACFFG